MKKVLGLDIGVASIGWAYIHQATQDNEISSIVGTGVRVVPLGTEAADFTQGKAVTVNAKRRQARGARRNLQRWKWRRKKLTQLLSEQGMLPKLEDKILHKKGIYQLRAKAAQEQIALTELGRVLLMMNQKRGYQSNRKVVNTDEEQGDYLAKISHNSQQLVDNNQTVGQYLYQQLCENPHARLKGQIFYRSDYRAEFEQIWQTQRVFYPNVLTANLKKEIGDYTLFYQRDLKSQKGRVLKCRFEPKYRVVPKSSPFFQHFRVWQNINNLEVYDDEGNTFQLTTEQKEDLFFELDQVAKLSATQTLRKLGFLPTKKYRLNFTEVQGNRTKAAFLKTFAQAGYDTVELLDFDPLVEHPTQQLAYQLWHLLYATATELPIIKKLQTDFGFDLAQAKAVCHTKLEKDYGNISAKAIRNILPHLQDGHTYDVACELAGYRHADYQTKAENDQRILAHQIPILKRNSLRNPVVEKILNQVINLVNTIIVDEKYGRPDEIRVELARELKQNAKKRKSVTENNNKRKRENDRIRDILATEFKFKKISRAAIQKYKMWEESGKMSIYTGDPIKAAHLFDKTLYEVEHIIPRSRLFDDSFLNKTISESAFNKAKDAQTAYDYIESLGAEKLKSYVQRVKESKHFSKAKKERLLLSAQDIPQDFINRQLKNSQYIAREAVKLLTSVCRKVTTTTGSVTDYLRHQWGLNTLLQELNLPRYRALQQTKWITDGSGQPKEVIENWSKRDDHRHHAIDALVIACTSQGMIQQLNLLNQQYAHYRSLKQSGRKFSEPWHTFRTDAKTAIESILISFKKKGKVATRSINTPKNSKQPPQITWTPRSYLHLETVYGVRRVKAEKKTKLSTKFDRVADIVKKSHREAVAARLAAFDHNPKLAFKGLKKNPILVNGDPLTEVTLWENIHTIRKPLESLTTAKHIEKIFDPVVKQKVKTRIAKAGGNIKKALSNLAEDPIWLDETQGIAIKRVLITDGGSDLKPVHKDEDGQPHGYVYERNNHHVAIYQDGDKFYEEVVSFWTAFERKIQDEEVIKSTNAAGHKLITSLAINEMFVKDLNPNEIDFTAAKNRTLISKHLYRVQKTSARNYGLRHHLATTIQHDIDKEEIRSPKNVKQWTKITINRLGEIVVVHSV